jgi:hypothetical protein
MFRGVGRERDVDRFSECHRDWNHNRENACVTVDEGTGLCGRARPVVGMDVTPTHSYFVLIPARLLVCPQPTWAVPWRIPYRADQPPRPGRVPRNSRTVWRRTAHLTIVPHSLGLFVVPAVWTTYAFVSCAVLWRRVCHGR